jgi:hypothetical protein
VHDHAESERRRQEEEHQMALRDLRVERQINLVFEGALSRIKGANGALVPSAHQTATDALDAARRLRGK